MELILRTAAIYLVLMVLFRLLGKRSLAELSAFDFILFLIISEAIQNALVDDDKSVVMGLTVILTFLMLDLVLSFLFWKRIRRPLAEYQGATPPPVRAARLADEFNRLHGRPLQYQRGGWIRYVMTVAGPEPLETQRSRIDYDHYVTRQLQPIADAILPFLGDDFASLTTLQQTLF